MGLCLDTDKAKYEDQGEEINKLRNKSLIDKGEEEYFGGEQAQEIDIEDEEEFKANQDSQSIANQKKNQKKVSLQDFEFLKVVGRGSFGKVMLVAYKATGQLYAMKILRKDAVSKRNQKLHTRNERQILECVKHPFIVQLHFAFQTQAKLYLITDFMIGGKNNGQKLSPLGELFFHLRRSFKFNEERSKLYAAELVLALEYLHNKGVIYRDLKPENILLGQDGHIKVTDFGLSKVNLQDGEKTHTFCGTPEYLAPEILLGKGHDRSVDWWSLGALLYEMLSGAPPFYSKDKTLMFKNRLEKPIEMKPWFSQNAVSILQALLCNDPKYRIGSTSIEEIKSHPFFADIDWVVLYRKQIEPPFKPKITNNRDIRHFDPMFTDEPVADTPVMWDHQQQDEYDKFSFARGGESFNSRMSYSNPQQQKHSGFLEVNPNFALTKSDK